FRPGDYSLFEHNCNTFSEHFIFHLTGQHIPSYILNLPNEVLSTSFGASLGSALNVLSVGINSKTRLNSIKETPSNNDKHTYADIIKSFRPIFFDVSVLWLICLSFFECFIHLIVYTKISHVVDYYHYIGSIVRYAFAQLASNRIISAKDEVIL
ncbi:unnamed protein product, partial [Schistosoma mattheei]